MDGIVQGISSFTLVILAGVAAFSSTLLIVLVVAVIAARRQHERECAELEAE